MIAIDTNVLLRAIVEDDPTQTGLARQLLASISSSEETCYLSDSVLCELEWVLRSQFKRTRPEILVSLQAVLEQTTFVFDDRAAVAGAVATFQASKLGFADCLIAARAQARGVRTTYTFDRPLSRQPGLTLLR